MKLENRNKVLHILRGMAQRGYNKKHEFKVKEEDLNAIAKAVMDDNGNTSDT